MCSCVRACVCVYVCMYVCMYVCVCVCSILNLNRQVQLLGLNIHMHVSVCICVVSECVQVGFVLVLFQMSKGALISLSTFHHASINGFILLVCEMPNVLPSIRPKKLPIPRKRLLTLYNNLSNYNNVRTAKSTCPLKRLVTLPKMLFTDKKLYR